MLRNAMPLGGLLVCLLSIVPAPARAAATGEFADFRALWVSRFEYRNLGVSGVQQIVNDAAGMGITDLLFQVRGQGDAYYNSNFEPRAEALTGSWDPLQTAIDAAHAQGIKVHAWINTMPLWNGTTPPSTGTAIEHPWYHTDPSYRIQDINGNLQPLSPGEYVIANPINPQWQQHINNVANDIVSNYDVDGLHLDYIRYIGGIDFDSLPHDAQSHAMFLTATGLDAANPANVGAYRQYIRDRITGLVGDLNTTVHTANPNAQLSAAVWRDPDIGSNSYLQEYRTWLENDLLDIAMPMIYLSSSNNYLLEPNINNTMSIPTHTLIAPGLGPYLHDDADLIVQQLQAIYNAGANGSTMFSYNTLFKDGQLGIDKRTNIQNFIDSTVVVDPPIGGTIVSLDDFEADEGHFYASPTFSGSNRGILAATAERVTSEAHDGIAAQQIDVQGEATGWTLRFLSGVGDPANNIAITADGWIGFWLMTETPGLTVQIALDDPSSADRGVLKPVIADGQWHLYQWDLDYPTQWSGWVNGDGLITGPTLTIDSIFFFGSGNATIFLDAVAYNNTGSLTPPGLDGDLDGDGFVGIADLNIVLGAWNQNVTPGDALLGDASGDGFVGIEDLNLVLGNWNAGMPPAGGANVPEPGTLALAVTGLMLMNRRR